MKVWLIALVLISCNAVLAENITARDGTIYQNVSIISASPERMLIVYNGGGCQVEFKDLADDALSPEQRMTVEKEMRYYVERTARLEKVRAEREVFEAAQRQKGLVEFEGGWVLPMQREEILLNREERKLELERKRIQIAKEKVELEQQQLQAEKARYLLEGDRAGTTYVSIGYSRGYRRNCYYPRKTRFIPDDTWPGHERTILKEGCNNSLLSKAQDNPYICFDGVSAFNGSPFNH